MNSFFDGDYMPLDQVRISPLDFGFIHSHATYDVMRGLTFFDKHYDRFCESCRYYGFEPPNRSYLLSTINDLLTEPDMFIWMIMWKGTPPSGSPRDLSGPDHFLVYTKPYYPISHKPVTLKLVDQIPRSPGYQNAKNFSWIELTNAQQQAAPYDTALVRNVNGYINEGPGFGVCFIQDQTIYTPATDVLPSVTIEVVEEICKDIGLGFVRKDFTDIEFDECFICSTSGGITPVSRIDDTYYNSIITEAIRNRYDDICGHGRSYH